MVAFDSGLPPPWIYLNTQALMRDNLQGLLRRDTNANVNMGED